MLLRNNACNEEFSLDFVFLSDSAKSVTIWIAFSTTSFEKWEFWTNSLSAGNFESKGLSLKYPLREIWLSWGSWFWPLMGAYGVKDGWGTIQRGWYCSKSEKKTQCGRFWWGHFPFILIKTSTKGIWLSWRHTELIWVSDGVPQGDWWIVYQRRS